MKLLFLGTIVFTTLAVVDCAKLRQDSAAGNGFNAGFSRPAFPIGERELAKIRIQKKLAQQKGYDPVDPQDYIDWNDQYYNNFDWNADYFFDKDGSSDYMHGYYAGVYDGTRLADGGYDYEGYFNLDQEQEEVTVEDSYASEYDQYYYYYKDGVKIVYSDPAFSWDDWSNSYYSENADSYSYYKDGEYINYNNAKFTWDDYYATVYDQYYYYYTESGEKISYSNPNFDWNEYYRQTYYYTDN